MRRLLGIVLVGLLGKASLGHACQITVDATPREYYGGVAWYEPGSMITWTLDCPMVTPANPWVISGIRYMESPFYAPSEVFYPRTTSQGGIITITTPMILGYREHYNVQVGGGNFDGGAINTLDQFWIGRRPPKPTFSEQPQCTYSVDAPDLLARYNPIQVSVEAADPDTEAGYTNNLTFWFNLVEPSAKKKAGPKPSSTGSFSFTPSKRGEHVLTAYAKNGSLPSAENAEARITCPNRPPIIRSGPTTIFENVSVNSDWGLWVNGPPIDLDRDTVSISWVVVSQPSGATVSFSPPTAFSTNFRADTPGEYRVRAVAIDSQGASSDPVEYVVRVVGVFSPSIAQRDGQIYKDSVAYLKASLGLPEGTPVPDGMNISWEIRKPDGSVLESSLVKFDDPATGAVGPGARELYPFFAVPETGIYSAKMTMQAPNYRVSHSTLNISVLDSSVLIFREGEPNTFGDALVSGINHVGFYRPIDQVVLESTSSFGQHQLLFNPKTSFVETYPILDGVQARLPKSVFAHSSATVDRLHDVYVEMPISANLASSMAGFINGKMGKGYTPFSAGFFLRNISLQKGTDSADERYSCAGLIERAAEVAGLNGGQGFMPRALEEAAGGSPGRGILLPSTLLWSIKHPSWAFSSKLINILITLRSIRSPLFRTTVVDTPVDFSITDPTGRKIEIKAGQPVASEISNAFISDKGDIIASAIPNAMNGRYEIELMGHGADVEVSVGFGAEQFHFEGMLGAGQTVSGEVVVSDQNLPPVASAGPDRVVAENQAALLDGSASRDPERRPLTFGWELLSSPRNSTAVLVDGNKAVAQITPDKTGTYIFRLTVSDGVSSVSDEVRLFAVPAAPVALFEVDIERSPVRVGERASFLATARYVPENTKETELDFEAESEGVELRVERLSDDSFRVDGMLNKTPGTKTAQFRLYQQNARQTRGIREARKALWNRLAEVELALEEERDPDRRLELLKEKERIVHDREQLRQALEKFRAQIGEPAVREFEVLP